MYPRRDAREDYANPSKPQTSAQPNTPPDFDRPHHKYLVTPRDDAQVNVRYMRRVDVPERVHDRRYDNHGAAPASSIADPPPRYRDRDRDARMSRNAAPESRFSRVDPRYDVPSAAYPVSYDRYSAPASTFIGDASGDASRAANGSGGAGGGGGVSLPLKGPNSRPSGSFDNSRFFASRDPHHSRPRYAQDADVVTPYVCDGPSLRSRGGACAIAATAPCYDSSDAASPSDDTSNQADLQHSASSVASSTTVSSAVQRHAAQQVSHGTATAALSVRKISDRRKLNPKVFALSMELIEHVSKGRLELSEAMIEKGASPDFADYDRRTPLHLAASEGHLSLVQLLLQRGANPNVKDRWGSKPVDEAVKNDFKDIAELLRQHGNNEEDTLRKEHHDGLELLEYCAKGYLSLVRDKIRKGAKATFADYDRRTPLHLASCEGHVTIVEVLLQNGADATFMDRFNRTPVDDAMNNGHMQVLLAMAARGVTVPDYLIDQSYTAEFQRNMQLIDVSARGRVGSVQKLLREGAEACFGDYDLRTPLHLAAAEGHAHVVRALLVAGADTSAEDRWGRTAQEEAAKYGHVSVATMLEEHAALPTTA